MLTGSDRAFAAGADIKEMSSKSFHDVVTEDYFAGWDRFAALRTPMIAAVAGVALGVARTVLDDYSGVAICDGYKAYDVLARERDGSDLTLAQRFRKLGITRL